jgi:hypothetical protein
MLMYRYSEPINGSANKERTTGGTNIKVDKLTPVSARACDLDRCTTRWQRIGRMNYKSVRTNVVCASFYVWADDDDPRSWNRKNARVCNICR